MSFQMLPVRVFLVLGLLLPALSWSQETRGTISGTVTDPQGATVPSARIEVKNKDTNATSTVDTSDKGVYVLPNVSPGIYTVSASAKGFKKEVRGNVEMQVAQRLAVDFKLELGATSDTITITAEAPLLESTASSSGTTMSEELVADLPLLGSNPFSLIMLTDGNSHLSAFPDHLSERPFDNGGMDGYSINGGPAGGNNNAYLIDGAPNNNNEGMGFVPPPDAVGEVKVITNGYDAEFGRTGGGITSATLRSGTNTLHASGSWNFRNNHLNSTLTQYNAIGRTSPSYHWSEPTATATGPVIIPHLYNGKNKTFFSYSFELLYDNLPGTVSRSYPNALERVGNFSQTIGANGAPITIYDPTTTTASGTRTAFAGGIIPQSRIDPVILNMLALLPLPNVPNCNIRQGCAANYANINKDGDRYHADTVKIDQNLNEKEKFFASFELGNRLENITNPGQTNAAQAGLFPTSHTWRINHAAAVNLSSILSPTLVNTFKVDWLRHNGLGRSVDAGVLDTDFGLSPALGQLFGASNFPGLGMGTYTGFAQSGTAASTLNTNWSVEDTLNKVHGKHSFKFGGVMTETLQNNYSLSAIPALAFSAVFTQANYATADNNSGDGAATALLGYPTGGSYTNPFDASYATRYYAAFINDDWKVAKNLTLTLGMRWDEQTPTTERYDRGNAGFNPTAIYNIGTVPVHGGLTFLSGDQRSPYNKNLTNFQPRLGIAYNISRKLVFRGGWGRSYIQGYNFPGSTGFTTSTSVVSSPDGLNKVPTPGLSANGFAQLYGTALNQPTGASLGAATSAGNSVSFIDPNYKLPYVNQFNAGFDYELPSRVVLHFEYNGSRTRNLAVTKPLNVLGLSQYLSLGASQQTSVANPYAGLLPGTSLNSATTTVGQLDLPYPQFTGVSETNIPIGKLWYNAMQVRADKRVTQGLTVLATYTWSKNMGATDYMNANYDCLDCLRNTLQSIDQPQLVSISMTYRVPFFAKSANHFMRTAVGGWTIAGSSQFQSGNLIASPTQNGTNAFVQSTGINPSKPDGYFNGPSPAQYFNTCTVNATTGARTNCLNAGEPAAWLIEPNFGLATLSPRFSGVRTVRPPTANISLFKAFAIRETMKFTIRFEAFNLTNSPWFGFGDNGAGVGTNASTGTFGKGNAYPILDQGNDPRTIQLSARFSF